MKKSFNEKVLKFMKARLGDSFDIIFQELSLQGQKVNLIYIKSICDTNKVQERIVKPYFEISEDEKFESYIKSIEGSKELEDLESALKDVLKGHLILLCSLSAYVIDFKIYVNEGVSRATVETTIQGPQTSLSEDMATNLNLLRHRYRQPTLTVENYEVGKTTNLGLLLLYDREKCDPIVKKKIKEKIEEIKDIKDVVQSPGEFHRMLTPKKRTLFPNYMITERTDRITLNLSQGKVVILIEGSPFSLILPAAFFDFMSSMEDRYQPYWVSKFLLTLRYIGLFISLVLPAAYVGITSYNPELFRIQLALGIAASRASIPYPSYIEVMLMLLMMELLTEASIRLPKSIGSTATTVGGLILGQAATEAGLVSNIMIIIVSAVAISNFVIPINEMSFAMRVVKYLILFVTIFSGLVGLVVSFIALVLYLIRLDSFGQPYLRVFFSESHKK